LTYNDIVLEIKQGNPKPIYFLEGDESYYIDKVTSFIEKNALPIAEQSFNQTIFYGKEVDGKVLLDSLKRFPMMSPFQVVILKEAKQFKNWDLLETYLEKPFKSTIFVIGHKNGTIDGRKKIGKLLSKSSHIGYFKSDPIKEWDIENWIKNFVKENNYKINTATAALLKEYLGTDLSVIVNELNKIMLNIPLEAEIDEALVEKYIGISREFNIFEFQKALGQNDSLKAFKFVQHCQSNPKSNPLILTVSSLYSYFSKLYLINSNNNVTDKDIPNLIGVFAKNSFLIVQEYKNAAKNYSILRNEKILSLLLEYDLKSKGVNNSSLNDGELLKELTIKILN
jgi:DNA polymerase-3 subunit delta